MQKKRKNKHFRSCYFQLIIEIILLFDTAGANVTLINEIIYHTHDSHRLLLICIIVTFPVWGNETITILSAN
jgi:hypothetical protein